MIKGGIPPSPHGMEAKPRPTSPSPSPYRSAHREVRRGYPRLDSIDYIYVSPSIYNWLYNYVLLGHFTLGWDAKLN